MIEGQNLDRHLTARPWVVGGVDDPHPAAAEFGEDRIRAEGGAWGEGHGWGLIIAPREGPRVRSLLLSAGSCAWGP